jgi:hypothetical protein
MKKIATNYVPVLPRELRPKSSLDGMRKICNSDLSKLCARGREEEKNNKFRKKPGKRKVLKRRRFKK